MGSVLLVIQKVLSQWEGNETHPPMCGHFVWRERKTIRSLSPFQRSAGRHETEQRGRMLCQGTTPILKLLCWGYNTVRGENDKR